MKQEVLAQSRSLRAGSILLSFILFALFVNAGNEPLNDAFNLSVRLQDIYNKDFEIRLQIKPNVPFQITTENGALKNAISGTLGPPHEGKFPLVLRISESISERDNMIDNWDLSLRLGELWSGGAVSSIVYLRTVRLSDITR